VQRAADRLGDDVDHAGDRALAEQGALRPFKISMRAMSVRSWKAMNCAPSGMSSSTTATSDSTPMPIDDVPMPRMLMPLLAAVVP